MFRWTENGIEITDMRMVPRYHPRQWGNPECFHESTFDIIRQVAERYAEALRCNVIQDVTEQLRKR